MSQLHRIGAIAAAVVLLGGAWLFLAPRQLGGSASYAVIAGTSMEPGIHRGDLVVTRARADYRVGDAVVYRSADLDRSVLHRVIAREGQRYVFKGDNNNFVDPEHPERHDLLGKLWLRIPRAGALLEWLRAPLHAAILVGLAVLLALGGGLRTPTGRRGHAAPRPEERLNAMLDGADPRVLALGAALILAVALAAVAFGRDGGSGVLGSNAWSQHGTYSYSARAPRGPVYPHGRVETGDAVFLRLVRGVGVRFAYDFASPSEHAVGGTAALRVAVRGDNGWTTSLPLARPRRFSGDHVVVRGRLDLARLRSLVDRVERLTSTTSGTYTLTLEPEIRVHGLVGGRQIRDAFSPQLTFALDTLHLQLRQSDTSGVPGAPPVDPLHPSQTAPAPDAAAPASVGPLALPVARALGVLGILASLGGLLALGVGRGEEEEDAHAIAARYGTLVVPVGKPKHTLDGWAVEVESLDALAQLAERYERAILHQRGSWGDSYFVESGGVAYRYTPPPPEPQLDGSEVPSAAPTAL